MRILVSLLPWLALLASLSIVRSSRTGEREPIGVPPFWLLFPSVVAGLVFGTGLVMSSTGGTFSYLSPNEHSNWPAVGGSVLDFYVQDIGHPALIHNGLLIAGTAVGGLPLMRLIHCTGIVAMAVCVAIIGARRGQNALALLTVFALLEPDLVTRLLEIRPYLTEVITGILAAGTVLGTMRQNDRAMVLWAGLLTLDNPIALPFFAGLCLFRATERHGQGQSATPLILVTVFMTAGVFPAALMASTEHLANAQATGASLSPGHSLWMVGALVAVVVAWRSRCRALATACVAALVAVHVVMALGIITGEPKLFTYLIAPLVLLAADGFDRATERQWRALAAVGLWLTAWLPWGVGLALVGFAALGPMDDGGEIKRTRFLVGLALVTVTLRAWSVMEFRQELHLDRTHDRAWAEWVHDSPPQPLFVANGSTSAIMSAISMVRPLTSNGRMMPSTGQAPVHLNLVPPVCDSEILVLYGGRGYSPDPPLGCACSITMFGPNDLAEPRFHVARCLPQSDGG